jgi:DNA topoisomerase I
MLTFAQLLPEIRKRTEADLVRPGLPRDKVLATVVRLLETTLIRIGNEEYARDNGSFGLTTLRNDHVDVSGSSLRFEFRGKSGKEHSIGIRDLRLARIVKRLRDLPGQTLFQYVDDAGDHQNIDSADGNEYLREITGQDFTAKDFRTWAGTVLAATALHALDPFETEGQARRNVVQAIEQVATRLGNTPTVCRKCYVHPAVIDAYLEGETIEALGAQPSEMAPVRKTLTPEEAAVLAFLRQRLNAGAAA